MSRQREIVVEFSRERHVFENGDSRVIIADGTDTDGDSITLKGEADEGQLRSGLSYRFFGQVKSHPKYGNQFLFTAFTVEQPATEDAVVAYLQQCKGIGPSIARRLWDEYEHRAILKLRTDPEECSEIIKGLKSDVAQQAASYLQKFESVERTKTDLLGLLNGRGFPKKVINDAIWRWGSDAAAVIQRCPYYLMTFRGCGFLKTDKMYLELGLKPDRLKRQALCAWHAIARDSEGHTWFPLSQAVGAIAQRISGAQLNPRRATELAVRSQYLRLREFSGCQWVAEEKNAMAEERIAIAVTSAETEQSQWPSMESLSEQGLSEHQSEQLTKALKGPIALLTGSPGTGKTYTAAAVIREICRLQGDAAVAVCAPTGKAAVRLSEAMAKNDIDIPAVTIHRLLQVESSDGGWRFKHGAGTPLPYRFVVIDESSMIDTALMASLLDARATGTHYLFLGDTNQLAPVGHGAPLRDMILAKLPCGELREIQRNAGRIVRACADIRDGIGFRPSPSLDIASGENLLHVETSNPTQSIDMLGKFLESIKTQGKYDPVWGVQVLVAVNEKSPLGRRDLNVMLQGALNPMGRRVPGNPFRQGDKVINLKNGWFPSLDREHPEANEDGKVFVANGEIGEVIEIEPSRTVVRLQSPERVLIVPHGKASPASGASDDDDKVGRNEAENDDDTRTGSTWDLAYAISTHKSQGSEFPVVVTMIDEHAGAQRLCTRNWLYTALSRPKDLCVTIGQRRMADGMCRKDGLRRKTFLAERINELRGFEVDPFKLASVATEPGTLPSLAELFAGVV